jgi:C4-type Zn-finger protein
MARMMESREAMRDGIVRSLPASEQFCTRSCARCGGLLVNEWYYDLNNTGEHSVETLRCVQCGHRVDPVILQNQIRPLAESQQVQQARSRYSTRTVMLSEFA